MISDIKKIDIDEDGELQCLLGDIARSLELAQKMSLRWRIA